eukprot:2913953-Prymnesium_polylepis.1
MGGACGQGGVGWRHRTDRLPDAPRAPRRAPDAPPTTHMSIPAVVRSGLMLRRCGATKSCTRDT